MIKNFIEFTNHQPGEDGTGDLFNLLNFKL